MTTMRTVLVIFVLALIAIAGEIYSDALLTSHERAATVVLDPVSAAVAQAAHASKPSLFKEDEWPRFRTSPGAEAAR
jgi:hypothetical protein